MSHYWTDTDHIETRRAQIADWLEDVEEFSPAIVVDACRDWRRTQTKRPMPADIRRLCIERHRQQHERLALALAGPTDMDAYARSVGWANNAERMEAIRQRARSHLDGALAIKDQWARDHGYRDCADYQEREGLDDVDAASNIACSLIADALDRGKRVFAEPGEKVYTAEEMRLARVALGLEREPEPEPEMWVEELANG